MIDRARQAAADEGARVSTAKLCDWFGIPRRSAYYQCYARGKNEPLRAK